MTKKNDPFYRDGFGETHNKLFGPGPNMALNACVGKNGGPAEFDRYASGYFEAGRRLVASLQQDSWDVDCLIYPLVTLYRHGVETALKYLARLLPIICDDVAEVKLTHKLMDNWRIVCGCMKNLDVGSEALSEIESVLNDLLQLDPNGETFRYPEARDGARHLEDTSLINVEVFAEQMEKVAQHLEGACIWADQLLVEKHEMMGEERRAEHEMSDYYGRD